MNTRQFRQLVTWFKGQLAIGYCCRYLWANLMSFRLFLINNSLYGGRVGGGVWLLWLLWLSVFIHPLLLLCDSTHAATACGGLIYWQCSSSSPTNIVQPNQIVDVCNHGSIKLYVGGGRVAGALFSSPIILSGGDCLLCTNSGSATVGGLLMG